MKPSVLYRDRDHHLYARLRQTDCHLLKHFVRCFLAPGFDGRFLRHQWTKDVVELHLAGLVGNVSWSFFRNPCPAAL